MRALIFAAGKGERMRPLTGHTPKPLVMAGGKPLIAWHLEKLGAAGYRDVVINISWLAQCFEPALGDGSRWGLRLHYSHEGPEPLETGGGMLHALSLLGEAPFTAINGDIWTDFDLHHLPRQPAGLAHLVLVYNPLQHPRGDFSIDENGALGTNENNRLTYSGIGVYRPEILRDWRQVIGGAPGSELEPPRFKLAPLLYAAIRNRQASAEHHRGRWSDVGTLQRLEELQASLAAN